MNYTKELLTAWDGKTFHLMFSNPTFKLPFRGISRQTSRPSAERSKRGAIIVARPFHLDGQHQHQVPVAPEGVRCCENLRLTRNVGYLVHTEGRCGQQSGHTLRLTDKEYACQPLVTSLSHLRRCPFLLSSVCMGVGGRWDRASLCSSGQPQTCTPYATMSGCGGVLKPLLWCRWRHTQTWTVLWYAI